MSRPSRTFRATSRLADRRAMAGLSQEELAARAGCSASMIGKLERGEGRASGDVAAKVAEGLGMTLQAAVRAKVFVMDGRGGTHG